MEVSFSYVSSVVNEVRTLLLKDGEEMAFFTQGLKELINKRDHEFNINSSEDII